MTAAGGTARFVLARAHAHRPLLAAALLTVLLTTSVLATLTAYSTTIGDAALRHAPFVVNREAHDAWLKHMRDAVDELGLSEEHETQLWNYLTYAAASMVNTAD